MDRRLMVLPSGNFADTILLSIPDDYGHEEAYRFVTGLIAEVEEDSPDTYSREQLIEALEDHGFESIEFELGPELDL